MSVLVCVSQQQFASRIITKGIELMLPRLKRVRTISLDERPIQHFTDIRTHTHTHTHKTFAALRSVVGIPSCAIATFHGSIRVGAFAAAVAAAVVALALVDV